jgi:electron transfer flavoprotein alpha subunit
LIYEAVLLPRLEASPLVAERLQLTQLQQVVSVEMEERAALVQGALGEMVEQAQLLQGMHRILAQVSHQIFQDPHSSTAVAEMETMEAQQAQHAMVPEAGM